MKLLILPVEDAQILWKIFVKSAIKKYFDLKTSLFFKMAFVNSKCTDPNTVL